MDECGWHCAQPPCARIMPRCCGAHSPIVYSLAGKRTAASIHIMSRDNMFRQMPFWQACNTLPCDIACPGEGRNSVACMARRMSRLDRIIALGAHHAVLLRREHFGPGAEGASAWGKPCVAFTPTPAGLQTAASRPGGTQHSPHDSTGRWEDAQGRRGPPRTPRPLEPREGQPDGQLQPHARLRACSSRSPAWGSCSCTRSGCADSGSLGGLGAGRGNHGA